MSLTRITIADSVFPPSGASVGAQIVFDLSHADVDAETGFVVSRRETAPITDGEFTIDVWPNDRGTAGSWYRVSVVYPQGTPGVGPRTELLGEVHLYETPSSQSLRDAFDAGGIIPPPQPPAVIQQVIDAAERAENALGVARIVAVTASRAIASTDPGALLQVDSASLVTLTIPTDAAAGWSETLFVSILRDGVGACRIVAGAGVTLTGVGVEDGVTEIANIHGFAQIVRVGPNDWRATGWITEVPA